VSDAAAAKKQIARWAADPIAFVMEVFGSGYAEVHHEPLELDVWQTEFLRALVSWPHRMYALAACKGPGKSCAEAWAVWWFLATRYDPNIVCTSITGDNLKTGLWKELAVWYALSPMLQKGFEFSAEKIVLRGREQTWWCYARSFPRDADKSQQANTLAGLHARHVMFIGDEAGDFPDGVVVAAEGVFANDVEAYLILGGNTTQTGGPLFRAARNASGRWWVKRITGDPDAPDRSKRIPIDWARAQIAEHGRDHPWVKINVLGEFPETQANKLLGPDDIERANRRVITRREYEHEPVIFGVDTAGGGNDLTALCKRQGGLAFPVLVWRNADPMALADRIAGLIIADKPAATFLDTGGPTGVGVLYRLRQLGFNAIGIDFATEPVGDEPLAPRFANRRAEMYWKAARWVKSHGSVPRDIELGAELVEPQFWMREVNKQTKFLLEPKDEIKKRLGRSPDRADALALTFAAPVAPLEIAQARHAQQYVETDFDPWKVLRGE
jgi:hypothetical protein